MFLNSLDSTIRTEAVTAVTKGVLPATNFTPAYYTVCVYLHSVQQPIVHTFETEEERDALFSDFVDSLNEHN